HEHPMPLRVNTQGFRRRLTPMPVTRLRIAVFSPALFFTTCFSCDPPSFDDPRVSNIGHLPRVKVKAFGQRVVPVGYSIHAVKGEEVLPRFFQTIILISFPFS